MRRSGEVNPVGRFWKLILPVIALLCTLSLVAEKAREISPPGTTVHSETKMKGTVEEVKLPPKGSQKDVAHLLVKAGTDTVEVYLCEQRWPMQAVSP